MVSATALVHVAARRADDVSVDAMAARADQALYAAKGARRNRVVSC
jgi:PleD family two-component response regulator